MITNHWDLLCMDQTVKISKNRNKKVNDETKQCPKYKLHEFKKTPHNKTTVRLRQQLKVISPFCDHLQFGSTIELYIPVRPKNEALGK